MATTLDETFAAKPMTASALLERNGFGLYIPTYQRHYAWATKDVNRLFSDLSHGLRMLLRRNDSITFLGSIITVHDVNHKTVNPIVRDDVPGHVETVIDGQQRLSTLIMLFLCLHDQVRTTLRGVSEGASDLSDALRRLAQDTLERLSGAFEEEHRGRGDELYRVYPRMIRSYQDQWARDEANALYTSPLAKITHEYSKHYRTEGKKKFTPRLTAEGDEPSKAMLSAFKVVRKGVEKASKLTTSGDLEWPTLQEMISCEVLNGELFGDRLDLKALSPLGEKDPGPAARRLIKLYALLCVSRYVLDRVALSAVSAKKEEFAFDLFESLNTTGEPLTAFETFKPRVIEMEGIEAYRQSLSFQMIGKCEMYFECEPARKANRTRDVIVMFAMAEAGERLTRRLTDQRSFLRSNFGDQESRADQKAFLEHFTQCVSLHAGLRWDGARVPDSLLLTFELSSDAKIAVDLLARCKYALCLPILVRFLSFYENAPEDRRDEALRALDEACKAVAAFAVLWRFSRTGTGGIDDRFRGVMSKPLEIDGHILEPLARVHSKRATPLEHLEDLKRRFRANLEDVGVADCEEWVRRTLNLPAFQNQRDMSRFVLLCGHHDTVVGKEGEPFLVIGREGVAPCLNFDTWSSDLSEEVEHIAPQNRNSGWCEDIYDPPGEGVDRIGNLTLLPRSENASFGSQSWDAKRLYYNLLTASSDSEVEEILEAAKGQGFEFRETSAKRAYSGPYRPFLLGVALYRDEWGAQAVSRRGESILSNAWKRIAPWLGL